MRHAPILDHTGDIASREDSFMLNSGTAGAALRPQAEMEPHLPDEAAEIPDNPLVPEGTMSIHYHDTTRVAPQMTDSLPLPMNNDNPRPRRQRRGSDSSANDYWVYPMPPPPPPKARPKPLEAISSHQDLICSSPTKDRFVTLVQFINEAYITSHPATPTDFRHWFPLLASARTECWYAFVSDEARPHPADCSLQRPPEPALRVQSDARPVGLFMPWVATGAALQACLPDVSGHPPLIYLSVQQALMGRPRERPRYGRDLSPMPEMAVVGPTPGQPIYRVVRTGSRDAAAAEAFYHAGANRWSTVFTCVVKDVADGPAYPRWDSYERVGSLEELVECTDEEKFRVFY
ncbi:hypothetical protein ATEIFO6365_0012038000 [Aspergillus terreus]|uniref:Uncharacterized protein n=1 Tax=Aspergillus terreus TaxID=33178 RepID=A0A5M3ZBJ5_ASPTE|nr:hypothetical protein ATETN484_0013039100 [Aspergillus terreus]GFF20624.1 hypothetical protein ATEIFO6365_0012038000 [Aspergillus terreus]